MISQFGYKPFYERHLPHYQPPGATLFVTFRLAGSLPAQVLHDLAMEAKRVEQMLDRIRDQKERDWQAYLEQRRLFARWDDSLHAAECGPFWLRRPEVARLVVGSLHHRDGKIYGLDTYCVMSNHVHVLFTPLLKLDGTYYAMPAIMHSLKLYTASQSNILLGREGEFWQHESYDHVVRDEAERLRIVRYILDNPVKAGLVKSWEEWQWSYCKDVGRVANPPPAIGQMDDLSDRSM